MMKRSDMLWVLAGTAIVLLGGCDGPTERLRYRLLVEVETPEGPRTGSSVIEVRAAKNPDWVNSEGRGMRFGLSPDSYVQRHQRSSHH